jgi:hypothetical protein
MMRPTRFDIPFIVLAVVAGLLIGVGVPLVLH